VTNPWLLIASHIKPWRSCETATERLDGANGLMLTPDVDRLFDRGMISFSDDGAVLVSPALPAEDLAARDTTAERALLSFVPIHPKAVRYGEVWPRVLSRHAVRKADLNAMAGSLRKSGVLAFPDWEPRKRVPNDDYRISRSA
jgi:hypothetical protein